MLKPILITTGVVLVLAVVFALVDFDSGGRLDPRFQLSRVQRLDQRVMDGPIAKILRDRQATLEQLPTGKIVLEAPKAMKVGEVREVHANVGINVPIEVLRKHSRIEDTQSTEGALRVSSEMIAVLTGPGFKIIATKPEQQSVAEGFPSVWSWDIEARQEGEQELEATLYVLLPSADKSSRQRIDSYTHKIGVSVKDQTWGEWLKSRKEEIDAVKALTITGAGAITVVLGWLGWSYGSRKKNEELT
jgi:hypothetical protein